MARNKPESDRHVIHRAAIPVIMVLAVLVCACSDRPDGLLRLVPSAESGIHFTNTLVETDSQNIITINYMYHGGGVAIGDFNNDSLSDIFFTGNVVENKLYLNRGNLRFEDVSVTAGIGAEGRWKSGVAVADVNNDGWLDIYVCATILKDSADRANMLFIHQGLNDEGIPVFRDEAVSYGVADMGFSQHAAFLDYDKDGDLDLYLLQNLESDKIPSVYRPRILDGSALNNDRLFRNNGDATFTDVTLEAGIHFEGYGLGIAIADFNNDQWPDIYVGNDYISNDVLYINNRDGTFSNEIEKRIRHQSLYTMGIDVADINNDGSADLITLDMLPENNLRRKTISGAGATYYNYIYNREFDYEFQYMRNMLHLNQGNGHFIEIGQMAGIHQTEWSWAPLLVDIDNDGDRDLLVTNGFPKDVTDRDYVMFKREVGSFQHIRSLLDSIPVLKIPNCVFRNNGDLTFSDMTREWGLSTPSFSNGAAFADFDQDGDLDFVMNNINDAAFLYENMLYSTGTRANHFLRLALDPGEKPAGWELGTTIAVTNGDKKQFHEHALYRGYLSTVENIVHFGLAKHTRVDTLVVTWQDGKQNVYYDVAADQTMTVSYVDAVDTAPDPARIDRLFSEVSGVKYRHREWDKVDFYRQRTLPHKFSQAGPAVAVGDVNGDGLEDFIIGGSSDFEATLFIQQGNGTFRSSWLPKGEKKSEDQGLLLFDADMDGDADLYCVSGSYEGEHKAPHYQDRLYRNDGHGNFVLDANALPPTLSAGSCVRAADFDADGDLDLFVGGRVVPGGWPLSPESYLLRNDGGTFSNITATIAPELQFAGMITDALWTDYNGDGKVDLLVVGEFMTPQLFMNDGRQLTLRHDTGLDNLSGWWNSLVAADFDKDGDIDYIAGNLGRNNMYRFSTTHPLRVYAKDFDDNGSIDAIVSCYFKREGEGMDEYPVHFWDELFSQSPKFRNQFGSYRQYGLANMAALLRPYDTTGMLVRKAVHAETSYLENLGDGTFRVTSLPALVQVAPINGMVVLDINGDGKADVLMTGNDYGNEVFSGRYDACTGITLLGDGKGNFVCMSNVESGFEVPGDGKALARLSTGKGTLVIATQNADSLRMFVPLAEQGSAKDLVPMPNDLRLTLHYADGKCEMVECYYGSGYLSQSTRRIRIPDDVVRVVVQDYAGKTRVLDYRGLAQISE